MAGREQAVRRFLAPRSCQRSVLDDADGYSDPGGAGENQITREARETLGCGLVLEGANADLPETDDVLAGARHRGGRTLSVTPAASLVSYFEWVQDGQPASSPGRRDQRQNGSYHRPMRSFTLTKAVEKAVLFTHRRLYRGL